MKYIEKLHAERDKLKEKIGSDMAFVSTMYGSILLGVEEKIHAYESMRDSIMAECEERFVRYGDRLLMREHKVDE